MAYETEQQRIFNKALKNVEAINKRLAVIYLEARNDAIDKLIALRNKITVNGTVGPFTEARLLKLVSSINESIADLRAKSTSIIFKGYAENYAATYYLQLWAIEKAVNMELTTTGSYFLRAPRLKPDFIKKAFDQRIGGYIFKDRALRTQREMQFLIQNAVAQNMIEGQSVKALSKNLNIINEVFDKGLNNTTRIARTELLKAYSLGQDQSRVEAEKSGVEFSYIWSSSLDDRTRADHARADGQRALIIDGQPVFTIGGLKMRGPRVPVVETGSKLEAREVINCRCRRLDAPYGITPTGRTAKRKDGTWATVNGDLTAAEWVKQEYGVKV